MDFTVKLDGLDEIERKLKLLPQRIGNNAMRRALRKGANVIRDAARNNAKRIDDPATREQIAKNVAVASAGRRREKEVGGVMMRVGVRGGARALKSGSQSGLPGGDTTHWRWIELGRSDAPAQPFLTPAAAEKGQSAFTAVAQDASIQVEKELSKLR